MIRNFYRYCIVAWPLWITAASPTNSHTQHLKLESTLLALVDGNFMNATTLEHVYSFKRDILAIMWGDKHKDNKRTGRYLFNNSHVGAQELAIQERTLSAHNQFNDALMAQRNECLCTMKKEFLKAASKLRVIAHGMKPVMGALIEESTIKRKRTESLLLLWAQTPEEKEDPLFDNLVKTAGQFTTFCIDLLDFIGDLLYSCPKAAHQFEERSHKWKKFEEILATILGNKQVDIAFLMYVKQNHLDYLTHADITPKTVHQLLDEFARYHKTS